MDDVEQLKKKVVRASRFGFLNDHCCYVQIFMRDNTWEYHPFIGWLSLNISSELNVPNGLKFSSNIERHCLIFIINYLWLVP